MALCTRISHRPSGLNPLGRMALLFAALLILILPLPAAVAAQVPLVTIATRVVGTGPNPYSTQVGNANYPSTGAGPGYHVVALNRTTLAPVFNNTYGLDFASLQSMNNDVISLGNSVLVIISSIGPVGSISSQGISLLNNVATSLGGTGNQYIYGGTMSPSAYSLIGIPGLGFAGGAANQVSTYADPDTDGNIAGVLIPDINSNYTFTYSSFVTVQTITGTQNDTIMIGSTPFKAPPLAGGADGGFHVLIVKRTTIDRIATDPTVVILHSSYATNSSNPATAQSETHRMAMDLNQFPNGISTGNLIFIYKSWL